MRGRRIFEFPYVRAFNRAMRFFIGGCVGIRHDKGENSQRHGGRPNIRSLVSLERACAASSALAKASGSPAKRAPSRSARSSRGRLVGLNATFVAMTPITPAAIQI